MSVQITRVDWDSHRDQLYAIRHAVFVEEQGVPPELELDTHDAGALHLLAITPDAAPVATARMLADGHIGRMAVLPAWRHRGIGTAMLRDLIDRAGRQGLDQVFLHAQCAAEPFYRRLGFVGHGDVFLDAGIDHRLMRLSLRPRPD